MNVVITVISVFAIASAEFPPRRKCRNDQFECDSGSCISKEYWCDHYNSYYCNDRSNRRNCDTYPRCANDQTVCHARRKCIPSKWECDGYTDCPDGSDEADCLDGYKREEGIKVGREKARQWLLKQRRSNYGWEGRSHRSITALYLSNTEQFYPGDYESKLMKKQLQLHLSEILLKDKPIPTHDLALYVHSLLSTCLNPTDFQYRNFVQELKQSLEESNTFNPFLALALCNANANLSSESISKLAEIMNQPLLPEWIEQQAYAIMATVCIQNRRASLLEASGDVNNMDYFNGTSVSDITSRLKSLQRSNGSFGSLHTTALVMQALQAAGDSGNGWKSKKAFQHLLSQQKSDGSFDNDILATYLVLPVLNDKSLVDLGNVSCPSNDSSDLTAKDELDSINKDPVKLTYTIIVGLTKRISFSITFAVPAGAIFLDAMRFAEELDPKYRFKYIPYSWGSYVYSLFGIANDPEAGQYWQLYHVVRNRPVLRDVAPDKLAIEHNAKYIYWYRPTTRIVGSRANQKETDIDDSIFNET